jgi:polygalacturonase
LIVVLVCPSVFADEARAWRVTDYGATGDGATASTAAFESAIAACASAGGGRVLVPAGTFVSGPIQLRTNVDLHLAEGAVIRFSRNFADYPLIRGDYEGHAEVMCRSPLWGSDLHDVSITGSGTIDGQGDAWRPVKREKLTNEQWDALVKSGGVLDAKGTMWYPNAVVRDGRADLERLRSAGGEQRPEDYEPFRALLRPVMVQLRNCRRVTLDGPTFRNSPNWNVHLLLCEDVTVRGVTIFNPAYAQNGDGIDVDSCRNVLIEHATVDAGDDAICLKSGRDEEGRRRGRATENVTIRDCVVGTGHGGVVIGSEMSGGVRNVTVSNCIFKGTDVGLRFKTTRGRGGVVENVTVDNIEMANIKGAAILFDMYYGVKDPRPEPVSERTPAFRQFRVRNVTCQGAGQAIQIRGLPELPIERITVEGACIAAEKGIELIDAKDVVLRDVRVEARAGAALTMDRVEGLTTERLTVVAPGAQEKRARPENGAPRGE